MELLTNTLNLNDDQINDQMSQEDLELEGLSEEQIEQIKKLEEIDVDMDASTFVKKTTSKYKTEELINEFLTTKSDTAWTKLQEYFWFGIKKFAYNFVGNWDDAYDMTIETFINAFEKIDSYDPEKAKFSTWLWTICRNNCLGKIKAESKLPQIDNDISDIYDSELLGNADSNEIEDMNFKVSTDGSLETISKNEINIALYNISLEEINRLNELDQKIVKMKLLDDKKIYEIANELDMNESTVKNHLYKTKRNLSKILRIKHKGLYKMYIEANLK